MRSGKRLGGADNALPWRLKDSAAVNGQMRSIQIMENGYPSSDDASCGYLAPSLFRPWT